MTYIGIIGRDCLFCQSQGLREYYFSVLIVPVGNQLRTLVIQPDGTKKFDEFCAPEPDAQANNGR